MTVARRGRPRHPDILTPREQEVFAFLREDLTNEQIADRLGITVAGVKYHVSEILGKLGVASREEAVRWHETHTEKQRVFAFPIRRWTIPAVVSTGVVSVTVAFIAVLGWGLLRTYSRSSEAVVAAVGNGGTISFGSPSLVNGDIVVPVDTTAPVDPYTGFSVHLQFNGALLQASSAGFKSGGVLETSGDSTNCIAIVTDARAGVAGSCSRAGTHDVSAGGTLADIILARRATVGCSSLHLVTLNAPDNGGTTWGTFSIGGANVDPQRNSYGDDLTVDLATGRAGCQPTLEASPIPGNASGAESEVLTTPNPQVRAEFGSHMAVGDVDGDGVPDIAIAAPGESVGRFTQAGRVYVYSGATRVLLYTLTSPNARFGSYFGGAIAVGDVNGDGHADIVVRATEEPITGSAGKGTVYVFSGATGRLLYFITSPPSNDPSLFGTSLAVESPTGDVGADIEVGTSAPSQIVYVYSGASGSLRNTLPVQPGAGVPQPAFTRAQGIARNEVMKTLLGSDYGFFTSMTTGQDKGGEPVIVMGAPGAKVGSIPAQGQLFVFSGDTGALLSTLNTAHPQPNGLFGSSVAVLSGTDGCSGWAVAGAPGEDVDQNPRQGRVYFFPLPGC